MADAAAGRRGRGRLPAALAGFLLALAVAGPATAQSAEAVAGAPVFDEVWRLVRNEFFDPALRGLDWQAEADRFHPAAAAARSPAEISAAINAMLATLGTSHTQHLTPADVTYYHLLDIFAEARPLRRRVDALFPGGAGVRYAGLGAFFENRDGRTFVTGVWDGFNAAEAGLRAGDEIVAADGRPFAPIDSFRGRVGETVRLAIRRTPDGPLLSLPVVAEDIRPKESLLEAMRQSVRLIPRQGWTIGYVRIWSYAGDEYQQLLVEEMDTGRLKDADALLIDLRGGWGGASPDYLDPFLPGPAMAMRGRSGSADTVAFRWRRPVGLLVDEGTRSGKEILADAFRTYGLGPVIGERTAGAVVAGRAYLLSDDSLLYLAVADVTVDGRRLEGVGVEPDKLVPFDPAYAAGADPQLDAALDAMAGRLG